MEDTSGLRDFFDQLDELGEPALMSLAASWAQVDPGARERARYSARELIDRLGRRDELERLQGAISQWAGVGGAGSGVMAPVSQPRDVFLADLRRQAIPAVVDAAVAIMLGDALDDADRTTLLAPWNASAAKA